MVVRTKQIDNTHLTEGPMWNLMKIGQAVTEKKTFKDYLKNKTASNTKLLTKKN